MSKIAADVVSAFTHSASANILVEHVGSTTSGLSTAKTKIQVDRRCSRSQTVCDALQTHATKSQSCVAKLLDGEAFAHVHRQSFWIANVMLIKGAPRALVSALATCVAVSRITLEPTFTLQVLASSTTLLQDASTAPQWGVSKIGAPTVWSSGLQGQGVVVGSIDTGVLYTHDALAGKWRASHGWFDPQGQTLLPSDSNGHGTHVMGTILGANGIGVAPGATFITCNGCPGGNCIGSALLACAQFLLCPTDPLGGNRNCSMHPHVINNSWGGAGGNDWFNAAIAAWRLAGIVPIFAAGNGGTACNSVTSPGDSTQVIAVGATGNGGTTSGTDALAYFSSRGRAAGNGAGIKPDVSAPGYFVYSAVQTSNSSYGYLAGTSVATPHVTGAVALLLSKNISATYDDVYKLLTTTADTSTLIPTNQNCGAVADSAYPNNNYGYGRLNVSRAIMAAPKTTVSSKAITPKPTTRAPTKVLVGENALPDF
ncbi:Aste57867_14832 [Aphanomyces stellatus]|uniref:subtilisin n=1 Tax=Aphanomyces stellatus TaxID=120398 RepID=A0A485L3G2_9STRA|nr:hypothetical protein As57867_014776 [Aphanomyces stellatus]VFT91650.1 Aste57867_14832 [Aphanomyces stellatus]